MAASPHRNKPFNASNRSCSSKIAPAGIEKPGMVFAVIWSPMPHLATKTYSFADNSDNQYCSTVFIRGSMIQYSGTP